MGMADAIDVAHENGASRLEPGRRGLGLGKCLDPFLQLFLGHDALGAQQVLGGGAPEIVEVGAVGFAGGDPAVEVGAHRVGGLARRRLVVFRPGEMPGRLNGVAQVIVPFGPAVAAVLVERHDDGERVGLPGLLEHGTAEVARLGGPTLAFRDGQARHLQELAHRRCSFRPAAPQAGSM